MPTCTPQLCFGNTSPSYNGEPDYASYTLNPLSIELGILEIENGLVQWGLVFRNKKDDEFKMYTVGHMKQKLNAKSNLDGKVPRYRFTPRNRVDILQDITNAISGDNPEEVQDSIKNEIVNRLLKIVTNDNCQEVCADLLKDGTYNFDPEREEQRPRPSPFSAPKTGIEIYKAIAGAQVRMSIKVGDGVFRTPFFFTRQFYTITVKLRGIDFCKKVDDQFPLDLTTTVLDPKWQKEFFLDDPKLTLCDCLQITLFTEDIIETKIPDDNFLEPESAALLAAEAVTSNSVTNLVMNGFGPFVNPVSARELFQNMSDRGQPNQLMYGFLGKVVGFLTKHTTVDGPLVEIGWVIPLTADINGRTVLAALSQPLIRIGLNEAGQLVTNPYEYFQTLQDSLTAAGFGPQIPTYPQIDGDIANKGVATAAQTATNIDLNGTPVTPNESRSSGAGVANDKGQGPGYVGINYDVFMNGYLRRGTQINNQ